MKTIIAVVCTLTLLFPSCMSLQTVTVTEADYVVKVYQDLLGTQDQLYLKANEWMISIFNNKESVVQHTDKAEGVILGKYLMNGTTQTSQYGTADSRVYAIIDIRVKEGKARIEIKPQDTWRYDEGGLTIYDYSKMQALVDANQLCERFHQYMTKVQKNDF